MSIWGKVIGGVAGFMVGGPMGALLGGVAGHAYDRFRTDAGGNVFDPPPGSGDAPDARSAREVAFTTAIIVLAAKMAKADGQVSREEIAVFKRIFHIPPEEAKGVGRLFNEARADAHGYEPYAEQIARLFAREPAVLEELLDALFLIAKADGEVHPAEFRFLGQVASIFGFTPHEFARIRAHHLGSAGGPDAYQVLGVTRSAPDDEIKQTYRRLIRENHPDTLVAKGLPKEFIDQANRKMAGINAAYDFVAKERGLR